MSVLYISSILPARSETFVYREVFALRARGVTVHTASVNPPELGLGEERLDDLAASAIPVYGAGAWRFVRDVVVESVRHPVRTLRTTLRAMCDLLTCDDVRWARRPRLYVQALAGLVLARRIRRLGITRIHAHMAHVPTTIAMAAAHQLGIPFSFTGHANDIFPNRSLLRTKIRRAAFVSCISRWHRSFYREIAGVPLDRLPVIRCGVDVPGPAARACGRCSADDSTSGSAPAHDPSSVASDSSGATARPGPARAFRILAVGRLIQKKGFDVLLDAVRELMRQRPDLAGSIDLTIVGDGPEMASLSSRAAEMPASMAITPGPRVTLAGSQANTRVRALMAQADIFVLPCRVDPGGDRDGIPVVLMEAMAAGVPVISGRLPAIEELVEDGATGLMVPPGDAAALAEALVRIMTDEALRDRLGENGRARVVQEFSEEVNISRLMSALGVSGSPAERASPDGSRPSEAEVAADRPARAPAPAGGRA